MKIIFAISALIFLATGCSEYNPRATRSESESISGIVQLTSGYDRATNARFSPDMRWIVFQAIPSGEKTYQTYVAKLRYSQNAEPTIIGLDHPIRITVAGSVNETGAFSPNGLSLIFPSTSDKDLTKPEPSFRGEMDIFRVDGWEGAVALSDPSKGLNLAQHPLTDNDNYDGECSYSHDGKWIVFTSNRDGDLDLYTMHSDGTHVVRLTNVAGYDGGAAFSPDGKHLVYRSDRKGDHLLQIFTAALVFDPHGEITGLKDEHQLTDDQNINWGPCWADDGKHIVYATNRDGKTNNEIYVMNIKGRQKTRVTFFDGFDLLPIISPDGRYLMWSSTRSADKTMEIYIATFVLPDGS